MNPIIRTNYNIVFYQFNQFFDIFYLNKITINIIFQFKVDAFFCAYTYSDNIEYQYFWRG